ncbi:hypothetical protein [Aggregatilinea lenta]|uniref:hypothetical protein n=1 Tax=Aggregatilinea lenta TaxID=913108 RepID=UPI000E5AC2AE|nr:hypothetical protein [Aggregatilinea lenta]
MYDDYKVVTIRSKAFDELLAQSGIFPENREKFLALLLERHDRDFLSSVPPDQFDERGWPTTEACKGIGMHEIVLPDNEGRKLYAKIAGYFVPAGSTIFRVRRFIVPDEEYGVMNVHRSHLRAAGIEVKEPRRS